MIYLKTLLLSLFVAFNVVSYAQGENDVLDLKDPVLGKWGFASKQQNRKSALKGVKKFAVSLGKIGSSVMTKGDSESIDWVIPPQYDAVSADFSERLAAVEVDGKVGYIDVYNRFIIEPQYQPVKKLEGFNLGLSTVKIGEKYGFINKKGETIIPAQYDYAENFNDNMLATIKMEGKFGAIDLFGNIVVPCKYSLEATMTTVPISNKVYKHVSDSIKKELLNLSYSKILSELKACTEEVDKRISDSLWIQPLETTTVNKDNTKGIKDNYGRMIIPCQFSNIDYDATNHLYVVKGAWQKLGLYSYKGDCIFHPVFNSMSAFNEGFSTATVEGIEGTIGSDGWVDPAFMDNICNEGLRHDTEGNVDKAQTLYECILNIDPNHVMALNNLAIIDINNKDYNKGMRKLKIAHKIAPDNELISENLHTAKKNRNQRRWNRITTGLEIAAAVISLGAMTYSTVSGASSSGFSSSSATSSSVSSYSGSKSSASGGSIKGGKPSNGLATGQAWKTDSDTYADYDSQLAMHFSGNRPMSASDARTIQQRMRSIRKKWEARGKTITEVPNETR